MGLNGTGAGSRPKNNSAGRTVKNTKLSSTGGSIAKNNTDFNKGGMKTSGGLAVKSRGEVVTNPEFDTLSNTGRPKGGAMKAKNKLPNGMTQQTAKSLPIGRNRYGQPNKQTQVQRGAGSDTTVSNLKDYLDRKAKGQVR